MTATQDPLDPLDVLKKVIENVHGELRDGQFAMVKEIEEAIAHNGHRVIQAGTGTGKSLGYLIPAAACSLNNHTGSVVVSTATLALQKQLMEKDLPTVAETLATDFGMELKYAVLKGRNNYVCLQKLHSKVPDPEQDELFETGVSSLGAQAIAVREWAESTVTGDRDEYPEDIDARVWRGFSVSRRECIGETKCAFGDSCFTAKQREAASDAHIVVTNHALLAIDVIEGIPVLPDHEVVIIDEGHEIVDRATSAITSELNVSMVERALSSAKSLIDQRSVDLAADAIESLDLALHSATTNRGANSGLTQLDPEMVVALTLIRDSMNAAMTDIGSQKSNDPDVTAKNQRVRGALEEVYDLAGSILSGAHSLSNDYVIWVDQVSGAPVLHCAPLSISGLLEDRLFHEKCVVVTSATLTVGGTFDAITKSLGVHSDPRLGAIDVGSPFDYPSQGILYVASHVDPPSRDGISMAALDEMGELVEAAGGRSLILCSSWRAVERAAEYLRVRVDTPLLVQRKGESVGLLVNRFAADVPSSLIGTLSLWQGVDIPGPSCSQVIIDRIPFPRPDDPVMSARAKAVDDSGGSGFNSIMVSRAGLMLAQAAGRLIRQSTDKGVVSVLDPRLATASYGRSLRASMPPLWFTTNKDATLAALRRLGAESETTKP